MPSVVRFLLYHSGRENVNQRVSTACIQRRDVHALGLQLYRSQRRHGGVRATQHHFSHKIQGTDFFIEEFTSMTTKRSAGRGSRHISLRFYVYSSTLTQCIFDSPTSHSFHGSNSSNSKDNGLVVFRCSIKYKPITFRLHRSGGRTYNIPNYATRFVVPLQFQRVQGWTSASYANEKSNVISVTFDEDKKTPKAIITILVIFLLFAAIPVFLMAPKSVERVTSTTDLYDPSKQQINWVRKQFQPARFF